MKKSVQYSEHYLNKVLDFYPNRCILGIMRLLTLLVILNVSIGLLVWQAVLKLQNRVNILEKYHDIQ